MFCGVGAVGREAPVPHGGRAGARGEPEAREAAAAKKASAKPAKGKP